MAATIVRLPPAEYWHLRALLADETRARLMRDLAVARAEETLRDQAATTSTAWRAIAIANGIDPAAPFTLDDDLCAVLVPAAAP